MTESTLSTESTLIDLAGHYAAASAHHDTNAILALHSEDSVFEVHGGGLKAKGLTIERRLTPSSRPGRRRASNHADPLRQGTFCRRMDIACHDCQPRAGRGGRPPLRRAKISPLKASISSVS